MTLLYAVLLGLVQGLTEFLPVSSTAHLTLAENLLLRRSMPLAFDVLLHVGTLIALLVYFRAELAGMARGLLGRDRDGLRLAGWLLAAMVPTVAFALATRPLKQAAKGHLWVYGVFLLVTAVLLYTANARARRQAGRPLGAVRLRDALAIGSIQGLGGGFGLSRSGSTLAMGVYGGLGLSSSVRFSFLLGIPTIAGAAALEGWKLARPLLRRQALPAELAFPPGSISPGLACAAAVVVAALSGYLAIGLLDRFTRKPRLNPFAWYCLGMGIVLILLGDGPPMIRLEDLHKTFVVKDKRTRARVRIEAVRGISLEVRPGEIYGLLGPNGAGKSTTLRMIAGLMRPDQGRIEVCGVDTVRRPEQARALVGYLSTDLSVYGRFTPRELLKLFGEFQGLDARVAERRGIHLLEELGLSDFADIRMEGFSGGQKQKVSIARALLHDPKVVIFDEPTTGLDVLTAKTVLDLLRLMRAEGRSVVVSTHVMPMVEAICDRVGIIFDGRLHGDAPPGAILRDWGVASLDEVFFKLAAGFEPRPA